MVNRFEPFLDKKAVNEKDREVLMGFLDLHKRDISTLQNRIEEDSKLNIDEVEIALLRGVKFYKGIIEYLKRR